MLLITGNLLTRLSNGKIIKNMITLTRDFFARPALTVARALLGQCLVRQLDGQRLSGLIVETEAYIGPQDTACHAHKGRTARTEVMFGLPGTVYVYLVYGIHSMLNLVTDRVDFPAAVLIRAIEPREGVEIMQAQRQKTNCLPMTQLANGPGKLCQALAIDRTLNREDVVMGKALWLELTATIPDESVVTGPRIGVDYAMPQDREAFYRFFIKDNQFVSRRIQ